MGMLKRSCCQWDGRDYDITMVSDESTARSRAAWPEIRVFEILVQIFTEPI